MRNYRKFTLKVTQSIFVFNPVSMLVHYILAIRTIFLQGEDQSDMLGLVQIHTSV